MYILGRHFRFAQITYHLHPTFNKTLITNTSEHCSQKQSQNIVCGLSRSSALYKE